MATIHHPSPWRAALGIGVALTVGTSAWVTIALTRDEPSAMTIEATGDATTFPPRAPREPDPSTIRPDVPGRLTTTTTAAPVVGTETPRDADDAPPSTLAFGDTEPSGTATTSAPDPVTGESTTPTDQATPGEGTPAAAASPNDAAPPGNGPADTSPTAGPRTTTPPTAPPPTTAPSTTARPATVPATTAPPVTAPPTTAPPTTAPPVTVPPTTAPPVTAPPTTAPPVTTPPTGGTTSFAGCSDAAPANALYVSTGGNDGNSGAVGSPLQSIGVAIGRAQPGQTVLVRGGTYRQEIFLINKQGRPDQYITVRSHPGELAVIESGVGDYGIAIRGQSSYLRIACMEFAGPTLRPEAIPPHDNYTRDRTLAGAGYDDNPMNFGTGISIGEVWSSTSDSLHHIQLVGNRIHDYAAGGIGVIGANHIDIRSNDIYRTAKYSCYSGSGISFLWSRGVGGPDNADGYSIYIVGNRLWQNENISTQCFTSSKGAVRTDGNGIILDTTDHYGDFRARTLVANNVAFGNGGAGIVAFLSSRVDVVNNTLFHNLQTDDLNGIVGASNPEIVTLMSGDVRVYNNAALPRAGMRPLDNTGVPQGGNVFFPSGSAPTAFRSASIEGSSDFSPSSGSPLIDAGTATLAPRTDYFGRLRTGTPDAGAIEG